jgi:hypothetical protein
VSKTDAVRSRHAHRPPIDHAAPRDGAETSGVTDPEVVLELRTDPGESGVIRAVIRSPRGDRNAWFATDDVPLRQDATPFIPAALLTAMRNRARLVVDGEVSPRLLANLPGVQRIFCVIRPRWGVVEVRAERAAPATPGTGVASFISMGLDSLSLAIRRREELTHLLMLRGFGSEPPSATARIERGARELAERDGKELILVKCNPRELARDVAGWTRFHGAALAGAVHAVSPVMGTAVIAASMWHQEMSTYPSNPVLDPLWSSEETQVVHEGTELTRTEKAISIAGDELAMRYLHPCFVATGDQYNCGKCGKCQRTMACLRAAGVIDAPAFDHPLDLSLLASQPGTIPVMDAIYREQLWGALTFAPGDTELIDSVRATLIPPRSRLERFRRRVQKRRAV